MIRWANNRLTPVDLKKNFLALKPNFYYELYGLGWDYIVRLEHAKLQIPAMLTDKVQSVLLISVMLLVNSKTF